MTPDNHFGRPAKMIVGKPDVLLDAIQFGVSMDTLMRIQNSFDIAETRKREGEIKATRFSGEPIGCSGAAA